MCIDYSVIKVNTPFIQGDWNIGIERGLPQCVGALHWRTNLQDMEDWVHHGHLVSTRQRLSQKWLNFNDYFSHNYKCNSSTNRCFMLTVKCI